MSISPGFIFISRIKPVKDELTVGAAPIFCSYVNVMFPLLPSTVQLSAVNEVGLPSEGLSAIGLILMVLSLSFSKVSTLLCKRLCALFIQIPVCNQNPFFRPFC